MQVGPPASKRKYFQNFNLLSFQNLCDMTDIRKVVDIFVLNIELKFWLLGFIALIGCPVISRPMLSQELPFKHQCDKFIH